VNRAVTACGFILGFVVGDDPRVALCIAIALGATLGLSNHHIAAWWLLPLMVVAVLLASVRKAAGTRGRL
jgi:hypothetical protein